MLDVVTGDGVVDSEGSIPISLLHKLLLHRHSSTVRNPWKASCWRHPKSTFNRGLQFLLHSIVLLSLETAKNVLLQCFSSWTAYFVLFTIYISTLVITKYETCYQYGQLHRYRHSEVPGKSASGIWWYLQEYLHCMVYQRLIHSNNIPNHLLV